MRHVVTPEREAQYLDAVFGASLDNLNPAMQQEVVWVRDLFVQTLGWERLKLSQYPFRALAEVARPGEWHLARLRGPAEYAAALPTPFLHLTLEAVAKLPHQQRRGYVANALLPGVPGVSELGDGLKARYRFTQADRAFVKRLCREHVLTPSDDQDARSGNAQFARNVMALLRLAYKENS